MKKNEETPPKLDKAPGSSSKPGEIDVVIGGMYAMRLRLPATGEQVNVTAQLVAADTETEVVLDVLGFGLGFETGIKRTKFRAHIPFAHFGEEWIPI